MQPLNNMQNLLSAITSIESTNNYDSMDTRFISTSSTSSTVNPYSFSNVFNLQAMPPNLLQDILRNTNYDTVLKICSISQDNRNICDNNEYIWLERIEKECPEIKKSGVTITGNVFDFYVNAIESQRYISKLNPSERLLALIQALNDEDLVTLLRLKLTEEEKIYLISILVANATIDDNTNNQLVYLIEYYDQLLNITPTDIMIGIISSLNLQIIQLFYEYFNFNERDLNIILKKLLKLPRDDDNIEKINYVIDWLYNVVANYPQQIRLY